MPRRRLIHSVLFVCLAAATLGSVLTIGLLTDLIPDDDAVRRDMIVRVVIVAAVTTVATVIGMAYVLRARVSQPLKRLTSTLERVRGAAGPLPQSDTAKTGENAPVGSRADDVETVAAAVDELTRRLNASIDSITRYANERQAVLASMAEGVIAVDADARVLTVNAAAAALLGVDAHQVRGRSIYETVRNTDLQRCVEQALKTHKPVETELTLRVGATDRFLQAHGSSLRDENDEPAPGAVVVLNDVTRLRQLEQVRQEFVANVSHELKTPITAIKAAVETLAAEARDDDESAARFLPVIGRQADRLHAIVEDLLMLARIEQDQTAGQIALKPGRIAPVLRGAVETCQAKARDRHIALHVETDDELTVRINAPLLEQAIVNLLDNAIKYSPDSATVHLRGLRENGEVLISVADTGPGIEAKHLPRLFERFYRTDRARSRAVGGTGLGLSIVKHVAQSHGGRVTVESAPSEGSTFTIRLPA